MLHRAAGVQCYGQVFAIGLTRGSFDAVTEPRSRRRTEGRWLVKATDERKVVAVQAVAKIKNPLPIADARRINPGFGGESPLLSLRSRAGTSM